MYLTTPPPDPAEVDQESLPDYYSVDECNLFVKIADFEQIDPSWLARGG